MSETKTATAEPVSREFVISRVFDAPRARVWQAFTEVERLTQWWGPKGFKMSTANLDLRPGGVFHYRMQAPNGGEMWGRWVFREIAAPDRLTFINSFSDKDGGLTRHPMAPGWPLEMLGTTTFVDQGGKTMLTTRMVAINAPEAERKIFEDGFDSMKQGFGGTWDQLADYLAKSDV